MKTLSDRNATTDTSDNGYVPEPGALVVIVGNCHKRLINVVARVVGLTNDYYGPGKTMVEVELSDGQLLCGLLGGLEPATKEQIAASGFALNKQPQKTAQLDWGGDFESLGDRMKSYEAAETGRCLMPRLPIMVRVDGRAFSRFTRDLARPYDVNMQHLMLATAQYLAAELNARFAYTQSDEISLCWLARHETEQPPFGGKIFKLTSSIASMATAFFNYNIKTYFKTTTDVYQLRLPTFDCRVWNVPNEVEAVNCILWRERDATRNSLQSAARQYMSHKELMNKNSRDIHEALFKLGINWHNYPATFKRGSYIQRRTSELPVCVMSELQTVERTVFEPVDLPPLATIQNKIDVLFNGKAPICYAESITSTI